MSAFIIGAVASGSAILGMGIGFLVTRSHYIKFVPKKGSDGKFTKR